MIKQYKLRKAQNNFEITLNYKGVKVMVSFTGGNIYKGILPSDYEKDPFKQRAIEASQMFKDGEITLERTIAEAKDNQQAVAVRTSRKAVRKPMKPAAKPAPAPTPAVDTPEPVADLTPKVEDNIDPEPTGEGDGSDMTFNNLGEAILFIAQKFNVQVQTEKEAREILKQNNINPHIKKG